MRLGRCSSARRRFRRRRAVGALASLSAGLTRFLRGELVCRSLLMGCLSAFAASLASFLRRKLVCCALGVSRFASLAGDLPLLRPVHSREPAVALVRHDRGPFPAFRPEEGIKHCNLPQSGQSPYATKKTCKNNAVGGFHAWVRRLDYFLRPFASFPHLLNSTCDIASACVNRV